MGEKGDYTFLLILRRHFEGISFVVGMVLERKIDEEDFEIQLFGFVGILRLL